MSEDLLQVRSLTADLGSPPRRARILSGIDFSVRSGEIVAIVGESGSGKSTAALALARLNEGREGVLSGQVTFEGKDVLSLPGPALRNLRGKGIAMVFQDAAAALNPCERIGDQIAEAMIVHATCGKAEARGRAVQLLREVGLPEPERRAAFFPHELSGGQRQRAMIAVGLACNPRLLIADEPTTALDVTVQAQILALLKAIVARRDMGLIIITHDLGVVAGLADRVLVMYAGRIVEEAPVDVFFNRPRHPYSRALIRAAAVARDDNGRLATIPGRPPRPGDPGNGCRFEPRCPRALPECSVSVPKMVDDGTRRYSCIDPEPDASP